MRWTVIGLLVLASIPITAADDTDPPRLVSFTLAEGPYAPGETLELVMEWEDETGVTEATAYGKGPGGLDFSFDRCSDPQGKRSVTVTCHTTLHERAPNGRYTFQFARAEDTIGHAAHVPPEHSFLVDSPYTDTSAPRLEAVELHTFIVRPDDLEYPDGSTFAKVQGAVEVHATDETGFWAGSLQFQGPGSGGVFGQCDDVTSWGWSCDIYVFQDAPSGNYTLFAVHLADVIGYGAQWNAGPSEWEDLEAVIGPAPAIRVVSNHTDVEPPDLHGITFPAELHRGQPFQVELNVSDATGIDFIHMVFRTTRGNADYVIDTDSCRPDASSGNWTCQARFPSNYPLGLAKLMTVFLEDPLRNHRHYVPDVWGHHGEHRFHDDKWHDSGTTLVPRPVEGEIEAIDAMVNEVQPRDVATIVYSTRQPVESVTFDLENATGHRFEVSCDGGLMSDLGAECDLEVPAEAAGVYSLVEAELVRDGSNVTLRYEEESLQLLAVSVPMPAEAYNTTATNSGDSSEVAGSPDDDAPDRQLVPAPNPSQRIPFPSVAVVAAAVALLTRPQRR